METVKNPIMEKKKKEGWSFRYMAGLTGLAPQTIQYMATRDIEHLVKNIRIDNYEKLKNLDIDLMDYRKYLQK